MRTKSMRWAPACIALLFLAQGAVADTLALWDFENATSVGGISTSNAAYTADGVTGAVVSQTGGGPAENFGSPYFTVFLTRFFGSVNYPFITFSATRPMTLDSISFVHLHNHNPRFPTNPSYDAQLQIDTGSGYADIGAPVLLSPATSGTSATVALNQVLPAGTYKIRWQPRNLNNSGTDTNTEFFALDAVSLNGPVQPRVIPTLGAPALGLLLILLAGLGVFGLRRRKAAPDL